MKDYASYDALGLAELVRAGEVSPLELLDAAIERIDLLNPTINAVNFKLYDQARERINAGLPDGRFRGVPFLVKDLGPQFAGMPHTKGCRALLHHVSPVNSEISNRFLATGLVPFAKTNTPELGLLAVTEPEVFGPTRSPWDPERTPGGSSGGSAAGVAAGIAPIASAGDGGGSIRIPASCCGLFGLKPSRGRTPGGPWPEGWQGAVVDHILSRSVRDSAAMLDAIVGPELGAGYTIAAPNMSYLAAVDSEPKKLRIGFTTNSPLGTPVDAECKQAVDDAAKLLSELGHHVEPGEPDYDGSDLANVFMMLYFGEVAAELKDLELLLSRRLKRADVETATWTLGLLGKAFTAGEFAFERKKWNDFALAMDTFHQDYDLYLTPTLAVVPPYIGENDLSKIEHAFITVINILGAGGILRATGLVDKLAEESMSKTPFTQLANLTGQPAMNIPLKWTDKGVPVGVQFMSANGSEEILYALAGQLERARPWKEKHPPLWK